LTIILGKVVLTCPETGEEVVLHEDCMNKDGKGKNCPYFKHFGIEGSKVAVTCESTKYPRSHKLATQHKERK